MLQHACGPQRREMLWRALFSLARMRRILVIFCVCKKVAKTLAPKLVFIVIFLGPG